MGGDKVLDKSMDLRKAVTMQREFMDKLQPGTKFFHPLPRDARYPTLPFWLDNTEFNGWDQQSQNGYFTRICLLGMLGDKFGEDFQPGVGRFQEASRLSGLSSAEALSLDPGSMPLVHGADFIREIQIKDVVKESRSVEGGLMPMDNGIIIDHLAEGQSVEQIWSLMHMVRSILGLHQIGGQGVFRSKTSPDKANGLISVPNFDIAQWDRLPLKKLAAMAPGSTLNIIQGGQIHKKFQLEVPPRIYNFPDISC